MFTRQEKNELKPTYEKCEYQTVEDLQEQIESIASCAEYLQNAWNNDHYLVQEVAALKKIEPGLRRYEILKKQYRGDLLRVTELE